MKKIVTLEEVRKNSILYLLYFYLFISVLYIGLGYFRLIELLDIQRYINLALFGFLSILIWLYKKGKIGYRSVVYILLVVGLFDTIFIVYENHYNELRVLWLLALIPYAYLYGGKAMGIFTSAVTMIVPLLFHAHLGYTTQAMLTYEVTNLLITASSFFFIYHFEKMSRIIDKNQIQLNKYATLDFLTQTLNRRGFFEEAQDIEDGVVAIFDLDNFKAINDTYGHKVGDEYIKFFVGILRKSIRKDDILARFGGDEFIVLFRGAKLEHIEKWAERFYKKLDEAIFRHEKISLMMEASSGYAPLSQDIQDAIEKADVALYEAKKARGSFVFYK